MTKGKALFCIVFQMQDAREQDLYNLDLELEIIQRKYLPVDIYLLLILG